MYTKLPNLDEIGGSVTNLECRKQLLSLPPDLDSLPSWQLQHERPAKPHVGQDMQNRKNKGVMDCWLPELGRCIATRISFKTRPFNLSRRPVKGTNSRQNQKQLELLEITRH